MLDNNLAAQSRALMIGEDRMYGQPTVDKLGNCIYTKQDK